MGNPLHGQRILLGVTGSVAAYKAAYLASRLRQQGARVRVVLTASAERFVSPLTFRSVADGAVYTDADLWGTEGHVVHVGLAQEADMLVIAPCTANTLAKLAQGLADNLLTITALAATCPLILAPAMDGGMFSHPATQANLTALRQRGVHILGPAEGHLASGLRGVGRMVEPEEIAAYLRYLAGRKGPHPGHRGANPRADRSCAGVDQSLHGQAGVRSGPSRPGLGRRGDANRRSSRFAHPLRRTTIERPHCAGDV